MAPNASQSSETLPQPPALSSSYKGIWKYPTNREVPFRMVEDWLEAKRKDDDIQSMWRVHDKLYDFTPFIQKHPGGSEWLEMTQGTDITEAFEASHTINIKMVEMTLDKYFIRDATHPRISPYTFKPDGFYKTLKRRIEPVLKEIGTGPTLQIRLMEDAVVLLFLVCGAMGAIYDSSILAVLSGVFLGIGAIGAHNFFHIRDNWRRYYFDLSLLSSYEWKISHALSHHLYPNTVMDLELFNIPTWEFLPNRPKSWIQRRFSLLYSPFILASCFWVDFARRIWHVGQRMKPLRIENLIVFVELLALSLIADNVGAALKTWILLHTTSSYVLSTIGIHAGHHHPDIFHDGDEPVPDPDFGIGQLDATRDRAEDLFQNLFVTLITFGQHPLHHLFPTVCHSKLAHIRGIFEDTVREFKLDFPGIPQMELYMGCYKQLARTEIKTRKKID